MRNFDVAFYRANSQDLHHLGDRELKRHFEEHGHKERRVFARTDTTIEQMSMRWLRGKGIEVGAGRNPTPLFGDATCVYADVSSDSAFGGNTEHVLDLDQEPKGQKGAFDFAIAAHVLEHCDSFIRALSNLTSIVKETGVVLVVLPDKRYLHDRFWLPDFEFQHHLDELREPLVHADMHDKQFLSAFGDDVRNNEHADYSGDIGEAIEAGRMPAGKRFISHKHNYGFADWIQIMERSLEALGSGFRIEDCAYGRERMDCHFVLTRQ